MRMVRDASLNAVAGAFFTRIRMAASFRHRCALTNVSLADGKPVMLGYVFRFYCGRIFWCIGDPECALLNAAKRLLERIDHVVAGMQGGRLASLSDDLTRDLPALFTEYITQMIAWKRISDAHKGHVLQSALAELYREEARVPDEARASRIATVQSNMRQLLGEAALADFEAQYRSGTWDETPITEREDAYNQFTHELLFDTPTPEELQAIAPTFAEIGVGFEYQRFKMMLDEGALTIQRARGAIQAAITEAVRRDAVTQEQLREGLPEACEAVHLQLILSIVLGEGRRTPATKDTLPEPLRFDVLRLNRLRSEFLDLTTRSAMLATVQFAFRSTPQCPVLAALTEHLCAREEAVAGDTDRVIAELAAMVGDPQLRDAALGNLTVAVNPDDMVHRLM